MNTIEAMAYMRGLREEIAPVPLGLDERSVAERSSIGRYLQEKRVEDPQYREAIDVFKKRGQDHRDNLRIPDSEGNLTDESFCRNAFDYIAGMADYRQIAKVFFRGDGTYVKVFTPYADDYSGSGYIAPNPRQKDKTVIVEVWNEHRNHDNDWDPQLLEDYFLVRGFGVFDQDIFRGYGPEVPQPLIFTGVKSADPNAFVGVDHIAAFLFQQTGSLQPLV